MKIQTNTFTLVKVEDIAPQVRHYAFKTEDGTPLSFIPGQFITIHIPHEAGVIKRSYSLATVQGESDYVEFAASYVADGIASKFLFALQPGDQINAAGPFGRLVLRDEHPKRYIMVATGTGVTPYRAMLPVFKKIMAENQCQVSVLFGTRLRADVLYEDDFLSVAKENPLFDYGVFYSREKDITLKSHEHLGYVQSCFSELNVDPANDIVYLCGNPNMIDQAFDSLKAAGFTPQQVRREKYISSS